MESTNKFYAIYARVSTEEQSGSIESQVQRIQEYLKLKNESYPLIVYKEEKSGKNTNRPEYQRLLSDIRCGKIVAVSCTELSRISRSVVDFHQFLAILNDCNVAFISLRDNFDTRTAQGKLMLSIFASLAQFEREQISERTSANLQARARRGLFNGGIIYGYRPTEEKGTLSIDESEACIISLAYNHYLETGSYVKVATYLSENGYRTRSGKKFSKSVTYRLLRNPAYIGKRKAGNALVKACWPLIIQEDRWEQVQKMLDANRTIRGNVHEVAIYRFAGLLYCGNCNCFLESSGGISSKGKRYYYYRHPKGKNCGLGYLRTEELDKRLYREIAKYLDDPDLIRMINKEVESSCKEEEKKRFAEMKSIRKEIDAINQEVSTVASKICFFTDQQIKEVISPRLTALSEKKNQLFSRLQILESFVSEKIEAKEAQITANFLSDEFEKLSFLEQKELLAALVYRIEINQDYSITAYLRDFSLQKKTSVELKSSTDVRLAPRPNNKTKKYICKIKTKLYIK